MSPLKNNLKYLIDNFEPMFKKNLGVNSMNNNNNKPSIYKSSGSFKEGQIELEFSLIPVLNEHYLCVKTSKNKSPASKENDFKSNFLDLATILHDVRTPIQGCLSMIELAKDDPTIPKHASGDYFLPAINCCK